MNCPRCGKENVDPVYPHTCTPLALTLADWLERRTMKMLQDRQAAEELRRLHAENEALRVARDTMGNLWAQAKERQQSAEALLRRALTVMEESHYAVADTATHNDVMEHFAVIEALRERLGVKE